MSDILDASNNFHCWPWRLQVSYSISFMGETILGSAYDSRWATPLSIDVSIKMSAYVYKLGPDSKLVPS